MSHRLVRLVWPLLAAHALSGVVGAQGAIPMSTSEPAKRVRTAECGPASEACLVVDGTTTSGEGVLESGSRFGNSIATWLLTGRAQAPVTRILVLFDVSGSMKGEGMASVRPALNDFLSGLDAGRTRVGIAPFESHGVESRIRQAQFLAPAMAARLLGQLPPPGGNTGLYSAVRVGASVLAEAGGTSNLHLIVITDGANDVGRGDDPGLLAGADGLRTAVESLVRSPVRVWAIGIGRSPNRQELAALAGAEDRTASVATDPLILARVLRRIGERIGGNARLLVGIAGAPLLALGATERSLELHISDQGTRRIVTGTWTPPLFAPSKSTHHYAERGQSEAAVSSQPTGWWRWALVTLPLCVVAIGIGFATLALGTRTASASDQSAGVAEPHGRIRPSVREGRPRTPGEITASGAERIVRLPSH